MTAEESQVEKRGWLANRTVIMTSWASVSTALLLMALIGGAVYLNDVKTRCETDGDTGEGEVKSYTEDGGDGKQEAVMDSDQQTELYIKKNNEGAIVLMMATDYKKKLSTTYLAEYDMCFMAAGPDMDWAENWNAPEPHQPKNYTGEVVDFDTRFKLDNKVTDMSIVPQVIRPFCEGKAIYWLDEEMQGGLNKRHAEEECTRRSSNTYSWFGCICTKAHGSVLGYSHYCIVDGLFIRHAHVYINHRCSPWRVNQDCPNEPNFRF